MAAAVLPVAVIAAAAGAVAAPDSGVVAESGQYVVVLRGVLVNLRHAEYAWRLRASHGIAAAAVALLYAYAASEPCSTSSPRPGAISTSMPIADEQGIFAYGDLGWPRLWTIAECDGLSKYADPRVLCREKLRQERIEQAGWEVVRMTWHQVTHQPEATAARIRAAIPRSQRRRRSA
jgi:hypothetical protein